MRKVDGVKMCLALFATVELVSLCAAAVGAVRAETGDVLLYPGGALEVAGTSFVLQPLLYGGGQEKGFRSGTENTAGICGFAQAAKEIWAMRDDLAERMYGFKEQLYNGLTENLPGVTLNGPALREGAAHILNLGFADIRSEVLMHALEDYGIYVSSGSACASNKPSEKSPTLASIGRNAREIDSAVRFSFGRYTTGEDIDECIRALLTLIPTLRRFTIK